MSSLPTKVQINEEGPREGFQIEKGNIPTARKIELIDSLSETGLNRIQITSFVNPKAVPGMADAEEVVEGFTPKQGVSYVGLWLNDKGLKRAIDSGRLEVRGSVSLCASGPFLKRNQNRTMEENIPMQHKTMEMFRQYNVPVTRGAVIAAFGCNFAGNIPVANVLSIIRQAKEIAGAHDYKLDTMMLSDTMAWATPASIKRLVGAVQETYPELEVMLHLHDTRGMGVANAYARTDPRRAGRLSHDKPQGFPGQRSAEGTARRRARHAVRGAADRHQPGGPGRRGHQDRTPQGRRRARPGQGQQQPLVERDRAQQEAGRRGRERNRGRGRRAPPAGHGRCLHRELPPRPRQGMGPGL